MARRPPRAAVFVVALAAAAISWVATRDGEGRSAEREPASAPAAVRIVTADQLREVAADLGQPIYWAGKMGGRKLQLTELGEGRGVQVSYLPNGAEAGAESAATLTIGSYPLADPLRALEGYAERPGVQTLTGSAGREVVTSADSPTNLYFASPGNDVQVEVYDPWAKRGLTLALSGTVRPIG